MGEIKIKQDNLSRLGEELRRVSEEKESALFTNSKLKQQLEEYRVPEVLEYVKLNASLNDIAKKITEWERKLDIAQMAYRKQLTQTSKPNLYSSSLLAQ